MNYLFACGGTAGHVNPALAIAEIVRAHERTASILFLGSENGMENQLVKKAGYRILSIPILGFKRSLSPKNLLALYYAACAPRRVKRILKEKRIDVVVGTGGYVSWPAAVAAKKLGLPVILHESNAYPGLSVRMSEKHADKILLNFEGAKRYLREKEKAVTVGNPIKTAFTESRASARRKLGLRENDVFLLSFGGSLGAKALNESVLPWLAEEGIRYPRLYSVHAVGKAHEKDYAEYAKAHRLPERFRVLPYIDNMPTLMRAADIVVSRAGAATLSELAYCQTAAILIPSPFVANDHQTKNARLLEEANAAIVLTEQAITKERFSEALKELILSKEKRTVLSQNIAKFYQKDTAETVWREMREAIHGFL